MKILEVWVNTGKENHHFNYEADKEKLELLLRYKGVEVQSIMLTKVMKKDEFEKMIGVEVK